MKDCLICINISSASSPKVDHNKRFLKMVHTNRMLDDGGG